MEISVSIHDWLALPMPVRIKLREIFKVPRSKGSLVEGNVVKSDGTTYEDLKHITIEKMQTYLESKEVDFVTLFNLVIEKIEEQDKELEPVEKADPNQLILEEWAMHLARMQQQALTLGLTEQFNLLISKFLPNASPIKTSKPTGHPAKAKKAK